MRVTCVIDSLGSGGAQRQIVLLATQLQRLGNEVTVLTYHPFDHFRKALEEDGVGYHCVAARSPLARPLAIRQAIRRQKPDAVIAFLHASCLYAELAAIPRRNWGLVASERSLMGLEGNPLLIKSRLTMHHLADAVTANSHAIRLEVQRLVPSLAPKLHTIYNAVDLERFTPAAPCSSDDRASLTLVVVASHSPIKNFSGLVEGLALAKEQRPSLDVKIEWHGRGYPEAESCAKGLAVARQRGVEECLEFHPPTDRIEEVYHRGDALILASFTEGMPNVACEAMACGRPVLMSDVADARHLVPPGHNGFLFDPHQPADIARAILDFADLNPEERALFGTRSREIAEQLFDPCRYVHEYLGVLRSAAQRAGAASGATGPVVS